MKIPILGHVQAGFPSPAEEESKDEITLDEWIINDPNSTFMITMKDDSLTGSGILKGDVLLLNRGKQPHNYDIVVATVDEDFAVRHYLKKGQQVFLLPANKAFFPITPRYELKIEGVVYCVIRKIP